MIFHAFHLHIYGIAATCDRFSRSPTTLPPSLVSPKMGNFAYDDPAGIIAGFVVLEILTILCVALRFYSRGWKGQRIITSDWLILAAFIIGTGLTVLEIYGNIPHKLDWWNYI